MYELSLHQNMWLFIRVFIVDHTKYPKSDCGLVKYVTEIRGFRIKVELVVVKDRAKLVLFNL